MKKKKKLSAKQKAALKKGRMNLAQKQSVKRRIVKTTATAVTKVAKRRTRRTRAKKQNNSMLKGLTGMAGNIVYGAGRQYVSDFIANSELGQKLPVTEFTDEAIMLGLNWGARKMGLGKSGVMHSILRAQKTVEQARIGQTLSDMFLRKMQNKNNNGNQGQKLEVLQ